MEVQEFITTRPFVYHLTNKINLDSIFEQKKLFSTVELIKLSTEQDPDTILAQRRPTHKLIKVWGKDIWIRDQHPLNAALDKCLTDGWKREDFILSLNGRVFFWPTLKRLEAHFKRYKNEKPAILKVSTKLLFDSNSNIELCHLNSGATRPLNGRAPLRGKDTFKPVANFDMPIGKVAEVTFPKFCLLPKEIYLGNSPDGQWEKVSI